MTKRWDELRADELECVDAATHVAVLPVAATEQHGPHLPTGTDAMILDGVLARLPADERFVVLPTWRIGDSLEHVDLAGTLELEPETLLAAWTSLGVAARRAGFRKLAIVNSHGGQHQLVDLVAQRLRARHRMFVARVNTFLLGTPEGLFPADELRFGFHGGEVETSMMLALRPDLVRMDAAQDFPTRARDLAGECALLGAEEPVGFAWQAQDLGASGATGDAASADAGRGEELLQHLAGRLAVLLSEVSAFPLERIVEPRPEAER
ncbi:MAG: creatininase family protein [Planctomycetota bacterium]